MHQLHITIEGQHIKGSPFLVPVKSPVTSLGTEIHTIEVRGKPRGIVINHKGELVVTEQGEIGCVSVHSPSERFIRVFQTDEIQNPLGITLDGDGNILITDGTSDSIRRYSQEGQLLASVGTSGAGYLQFCEPRDVAFNTKNNKIYVADSYNHRIQVLNSDFTHSRAFGWE